ncbi:UPF0415 protein C7orf25 homolog [Dreissena polymorpha]|uniref:UPF0415 protein C7orf25 homolog n=1 Tax=Dreissena polymorpha TaxID=45954 RepID=UPI002264F5B1|nr:UPF0415 protein C7orf25 homolog [Dreissena polymorpha]
MPQSDYQDAFEARLDSVYLSYSDDSEGLAIGTENAAETLDTVDARIANSDGEKEPVLKCVYRTGCVVNDSRFEKRLATEYLRHLDDDEDKQLVSVDYVLEKSTFESINSNPRVNLDETKLVTLVSSVANGNCFFKFHEKILAQQAEDEGDNPVLPSLKAFLEGKQMFSCKTAVDSFKHILDTLGGPGERLRAETLLPTISVVPDDPSFRTISMPITGKIKHRSKIIFGTGDSLRAVTVTANSGFVRAANHQGVMLSVFLHASRALTERRGKSAERIEKMTRKKQESI